MKLILCIVLVSLAFSSFSQTEGSSECARIEQFFALKKKTAKKYWPGFNSKALFGPMIYYSPKKTYVLNPNKQLNKKITCKKLNDCIKNCIIGTTEGRIDTSQFNMQIEYEEEDSSALYYFNAIASISDLSIAKRFVPNIEHIEEWIGMILHESFHLYQTSFTKFRDYQNVTQAKLHRDTLLALYKDDWFKDAIEKEYDHLLHANNIRDKKKIILYIENFLNSRDKRYKKVFLKYGIDIRPLEDMLERSEGVARYMEYCMKRVAKDVPVNSMLLKEPMYDYGYYKNYKIEDDPFMNRLGSRYYYAIGMQCAILLERQGMNFNNMYRNNIPFEVYLKRIR